MARTAERGLLDMLFSGDGTGVPDTWRGSRDAAVEWGVNWPRQDLNPIMVAMSRVTKHIGYGLTYSSTFMHPYYTARLMNSLDHLTAGRIAMNLVASTRRSDFANFGHDELTDHNARYERMEEFTDVCRKLWDATESDAMLWDHATGRVGDPAKVHAMRHEGRFFKVEGPLNTPPSPQGRPVLIQAGGSPRGIRASAYVADHVFGADMALALQVKQRHALDAALTGFGRDPAKVGILWQTPIVVRETAAEANAVRDLLLTAIPPEAIGAYLSYNCGYDFSTLPERFTLKELYDAIVASQASPAGFVHELIHELGAETEMSSSRILRARRPLRHLLAANLRRLPHPNGRQTRRDLRSHRQPRRLHARPHRHPPHRPRSDRRPANPRTPTPRPLPHRIPLQHPAREPLGLLELLLPLPLAGEGRGEGGWRFTHHAPSPNPTPAAASSSSPPAS